jgi:hypothetical protein
MHGCPAKVLQNTTQIFFTPQYISAGQAWSAEDLTTYLTRIGYRPEADDNSMGQYTVAGNTVDIRPLKLSYFGGSAGGAVQREIDTLDSSVLRRGKSGHGPD